MADYFSNKIVAGEITLTATAKKIIDIPTTPLPSAGHPVMNSVESQAIALVQHLGIGEVLERIQVQGFKHVVQESAPEFISELRCAQLMLRDPQLFLDRPLAAILSPENTSAQQETDLEQSVIEIADFGSRTELLEQVAAVVGRKVKTKSLLNDIMLIADEMLFYTVFNAPFGEIKSAQDEEPPPDDSEASVSATTVNGEPVMPVEPRGSIMIGSDDKRLIIACRDPHGTISGPVLIEKLYQYFNRKLPTSIRTAEEGAGTQAFQMINSALSFYAGFDSGRPSVICCSTLLKGSTQLRENAPKNFHYFQRQP
jgi:hypothetical protein